MKKTLSLLTILWIVSVNSYAQEIGEKYAFKNPVTEIKKWDFPNRIPIVDPTIYYIASGIKFTIVDIKDDHIIFRVPTLSKADALNQPGSAVHYIDKTDAGTFFSFSKAKFKDLTAPFTVKVPFVLNAMVLPAKFRFANHQGGDFDFSQNLSVGPIVAIPFKSKKISKTFSEDAMSIIFGLTFNNITADEKTVPGVYTTKTTVWDPLESTCRHASLSIL